MFATLISYYEDHNFCGSAAYHRLTLRHNVLSTDGVLDMCSKLKCFWFIDVVASYLHETTDTFMVAYLHLKEEHKATFTLEDGNDNIYFTQEIEFTDCKHNLKIFIGKNEEDFVLMLPSEY